MKFCANCGNGNDDESKFCRKCGVAFGMPAGSDTIASQPSPLPASAKDETEKQKDKPSASPVPEVIPLPEADHADTGTTSLPPNIAHLLCYVAGWISGIVFLLIEKKEQSARFHAWQSIITFGAITVLSWLFTLMPAVGMHSAGWFFSWVLWSIIYLGGLVIWIVLMIKAYQGHEFQLPVIGSIAHNLAYPGGTGEKPQKSAPAAAPLDLPPAPPVKKASEKAQGTKFCISCGESLPQKAVFCSRCGEKQP